MDGVLWWRSRGRHQQHLLPAAGSTSITHRYSNDKAGPPYWPLYLATVATHTHGAMTGLPACQPACTQPQLAGSHSRSRRHIWASPTQFNERSRSKLSHKNEFSEAAAGPCGRVAAAERGGGKTQLVTGRERRPEEPRGAVAVRILKGKVGLVLRPSLAQDESRTPCNILIHTSPPGR